jgi:small-conductance mechanosensitive channel
MKHLVDIIHSIKPFFPLIGALFLVYILYQFTRNLLKKNRHFQQNRLARRLVTILLVAVVVLIIMVTFPDTNFRDDIMTLLGILVSAAIAISSATFIANTMSGLFLRSIRSFKLGDFIKVGDYFGRVSEKSVFHTEIQTEERQFIMLPNHYLINNPVTVIRDSGVCVSATVSLGYDNPNHAIEKILGSAAEDAGLENPFVQILELGDYSVTYRCSGFLKDTRQYFTANSLLRSKMLDHLHKNYIEIVSPTFMNQRVFNPKTHFIPDEGYSELLTKTQVELGVREDLVFDKADMALSASELEAQLTDVNMSILELDDKIKTAEPGTKMDALHRSLKVKLSYRQYLEKRLQEFKN